MLAQSPPNPEMERSGRVALLLGVTSRWTRPSHGKDNRDTRFPTINLSERLASIYIGMLFSYVGLQPAAGVSFSEGSRKLLPTSTKSREHR
jgi:hypothetical protein